MKTHADNLHPSEDEKSTLTQHIASVQFEYYNSKDESDKTMEEAKLQTINY